MTPVRPLLAALTVALMVTPALAQTAAKPAKAAAAQTPSAAQIQAQAAPHDPVADLLRSQGERYHRAPDSAQDPDELRRTQALNDEIVAQNDLAENEDRANAAAHAKAQAQYQAELEAGEIERQRHEADLRTAAQAQADYERRMADWRDTVAACGRGDRTRCEAGRQTPN
ncbi:hypothetical protein D3C85_645460 [compost metagenome]